MNDDIDAMMWISEKRAERRRQAALLMRRSRTRRPGPQPKRRYPVSDLDREFRKQWGELDDGKTSSANATVVACWGAVATSARSRTSGESAEARQ